MQPGRMSLRLFQCSNAASILPRSGMFFLARTRNPTSFRTLGCTGGASLSADAATLTTGPQGERNNKRKGAIASGARLPPFRSPTSPAHVSGAFSARIALRGKVRLRPVLNK
jgi:hypothetical protein